MNQLRVLIVDDEPLLRRHLQVLLAELWPQAHYSEAEDGIAALALLQSQAFDVVFSDIQMPGLDGLGLCRALRQLAKPPLLVFCTAYNQHAISAFELEAVDYLLKPLDEERLQQCARRIEQRLQQQSSATASLLHLQQLLSQLPGVLLPSSQPVSAQIPTSQQATSEQATHQQATPQQATRGQPSGNPASAADSVGAFDKDPPTDSTAPLKWIKASLRDTVHLLDVDEVDFFLAEDKYTTVDCAGAQYLIRTPISQLEQQLDPQQFWRIHRGTIVRVKSILKVQRDEFGHMTLQLKQGTTELAVSRAYQALFRQH